MYYVRLINRDLDSVASFRILLTSVGFVVSLVTPNRLFAQTSADPGPFQLKLSGYENLVGGSASQGSGSAAGCFRSVANFHQEVPAERGKQPGFASVAPSSLLRVSRPHILMLNGSGERGIARVAGSASSVESR